MCIDPKNMNLPFISSAATKIVYLNDRNEIVPEGEATKSIVQEFDENGNLICESLQIKQEPAHRNELKVRFEDAHGNEVPEEVAFYAVYERYLDGVFTNREKVIIYRK